MAGSWERPKIKIPKTKSEWIWDVIGYSFFIGSVGFLVVVWNVLPDQVPAHYNGLGEVDRWGSKWELLILPFVSLFLLVMMQFFEKHPEWHNYPYRFNESNARAFYSLSRKMMNIEKNMCLVVLSAILLESVLGSLGWSDGLGVWFLPAAGAAVIFPIVLMLIKQRKIK